MRQYRRHAGCTHPVDRHDGLGCQVGGCGCRMVYRALAGPGWRDAVDRVLWIAGAWWLADHAADLIWWVLSGG